MTDIATLLYRVDSSGLVEGTVRLDKMTQAAERTQKSATGLNNKLNEEFDKLADRARDADRAADAFNRQLVNVFGTVAAGGQVSSGSVGNLTLGVARLAPAFGVAAGAAAALGVAWYRGSQEARGFNAAMIESGNMAGMTTGRYMDLAASMDSLYGVTSSSAAKTLREVGSDASFTAMQIQLVAKASEQMRVAAGRDVGETVSEFRELGKDPVAAIVSLNTKMGFLSAATYDQIRALKEQGREQAASTLAMQAYADEVERRTTAIRGNLGLLEKGWKGVKIGAAEAWDAMLGIGRADTATQKLEGLYNKLNALQRRLAPDATFMERASFAHMSDDQIRKYIGEVRTQIWEIQDAQVNEQKAASKAAARQRAENDAILYSEMALQYASREEKLAADIKAHRGRTREAVLNAELAGQAELAKRIQEQADVIEAGMIARATPKALRGPKRSGLPDFSKDAVSELQKLVAAEAAAMDGFAQMEATLAGPLAEANYRYAQDLKSLRELAAKAGISTDSLAAAEANLEQRHKATEESIRRRLDPAGEMIRQMEFEASLMKMSNADRQLAIQLRRLDANATQDQIDKLIELNKRREQEEEFIRTMDTVRNAGSDLISDWATGAKSFGDAMDDALKRMHQQLIRIAADKLMEQIFGQFGTAQTGAAGGWWSSLVAAFVGGREYGGSVYARGMYQVGERNKPELLSTPSGQFLIPGDNGRVDPIRPASAAQGAAMGTPQIHISLIGAPKDSTATARRNSSGGFNLEVLIGQLDGAMAQRVDDGSSKTLVALKGRLGLRDAV